MNYHKAAERKKNATQNKNNWLFNDVWCYLVLGCFDWKIAVFQQTVVGDLLYH